MAIKVLVKYVMQYRSQGFSRNIIALTQKVARSSVSEIFKRADVLVLTYEDIEEFSNNEVYRKFFPKRHIHKCYTHYLITKKSHKQLYKKLFYHSIIYDKNIVYGKIKVHKFAAHLYITLQAKKGLVSYPIIL